MNPIDDQLTRLFRAAQPLAWGPAAAQPPFGFETRVLAAWRAAEPANLWNNALLVRGLLLAGVIMALSILPVVSRTATPDSEYLQFADSSLQVDTNP
jgi:hypothetical protein